MTVYFANAGYLDLDTVRVMGVSVKPNSDNPIGYFGTGLKFAIATLLRTGHTVTLTTDGETHEFRALPCQIRGETFHVVHMGNEKLSFTTDLGRDWEPWMAFRELYSNCLDEKGKITETPMEADTVIAVDGPDIHDCFRERGKLFVQTQPLYTVEYLEIHPNSSDHIYYRGVRVMKLPCVTKFTYNFLDGLTLTEDRVVTSQWDVTYNLGKLLPRIQDPRLISRLLRRSKEDVLELTEVNFGYCGEPSEEFVEEGSKFIHDARPPKGLKTLVEQHRTVSYDLMEPTDSQQQIMDEAFRILPVLNCNLAPDSIKFVKHLGPNIYGLVDDGQILIPEQTVDNGVDFLVITLWEEYIHRDLGYDDCTRGMQQYLFDKVMAFAREKYDGLQD